MEVQLTIHQPDGAVTQHRFSEEPVTIGSAIANHIVYEDPQLAPHQLIIFRERGDWVIRNLARGVELSCNHDFIEPGNTLPLPVQAEIQMGSYRIEWVSEAPPEGSSPELARPEFEKVNRGRVARDEGAADAEGDMPSLRSPRKRTASPQAHPIEPQVARPVGGMPAESTPMDEHAEPLAPGASNAGPMTGAGNPIEPGAAPSLPTSTRDIDPADTASIREAISNVSSTIGDPPPLDLGAIGPDAELGAGSGPDAAMDFGAAAPGVSAMPQDEAPARPAPSDRRTAVDPFALDAPSASADSDARVAVDGYGVMTPARKYPFLVSVSSKAGEGGVVRVVPSFPGCAVTPAAARIDATRGQGGAKFWVTPIAVGKTDDAYFDLAWQGSKPVRLKVPCRAASQDASKLWAFIGSMCAVAAILVYRGRWQMMDQLRDLLPAAAFQKTEEVVGMLGGPVNVCLLFAIVFMLGALTAIFIRRPRKIRLAAKRP